VADHPSEPGPDGTRHRSVSMTPAQRPAAESSPVPSPSPSNRPAFRVLLDFDGTLVSPNVAIVLVEKFCPGGHELAHEVDIALHEGRMTLREAWARQVAVLPSDRLDEMVEFVRREIPLRPGARRLIEVLRVAGVPTTVVSGGLDFFIRPVLDREGIDLPVLADTVVTTPDGHWRADHPHGHSTCRLCGICKAKVVTQSSADLPTVFVGDGSTDRYAAEVASVVFARSRLKAYCQRLEIPHFEFEDLDPVTEKIEGWLAGREPFPSHRRAGRSASDCPISSALADGRPLSF
jgi:2-hydroxy-3-keto-5-methylthiopentenyl-1-phosphate phosphatase